MKDTISSDVDVYAEGGMMFNASLNVCAVDEMVVILHSEPNHFLEDLDALWKILFVYTAIDIFILMYKMIYGGKTTLTITAINGCVSLSLEYSKSIMSPKSMLNTIKNVCNSSNVEHEFVNTAISRLAIKLFNLLPMGRPTIPNPPEKIEKHPFKSIATNTDNLNRLIPRWSEMYINNQIDVLLDKMVTYYKSQQGFDTASDWHIAMIICQDFATIIYWEDVKLLIAEQELIARTKIDTPQDALCCRAEFEGDTSSGYRDFTQKKPSDPMNVSAVSVPNQHADACKGVENMEECHNLCREKVDEKCGIGAYDAVKGSRLNIITLLNMLIVSYHFSAPSSKSGFAKCHVEILALVIRTQIKYLKQRFPGMEIIYGGDSNLPSVKDSEDLSELLEQDGLFVGNDSNSPTGISPSEKRMRNEYGSPQRKKWGVYVLAAKMLFISTIKLRFSIAEGVNQGTPGRMIPIDHAPIFTTVVLKPLVNISDKVHLCVKVTCILIIMIMM